MGHSLMRTSTLPILLLLIAVACVSGQEQDPSFGKTQLEQLLYDRPSMQDVLPDDDVVTRWVIRRFNSGPNGEPVRRDRQEPLSGQPAENEAARNRGSALVRITGSTHVSGRDKWFMLVFELHNIPHPEAANEMSRLVRDQQIGRREFILRCVEHEFGAMQRTLRFFSRYPIQDATRENAPIYSQFTSKHLQPRDFQSYLSQLDLLDSNEYDPRDYFAKWCDQLHAYHSTASRAEP